MIHLRKFLDTTKVKKKLFQNAANYGGSKRHNLLTTARLKIFKYSNFKSKKKLFQIAANYGGSKRHNLPTTACLKIFKFQTLQITAVQNAIIYLQLHVLKNIQI